MLIKKLTKHNKRSFFMKNIATKRIISILLSLALVFGALFSLSSCKFVLGSVLDDGQSDGGDGSGDVPPVNNGGDEEESEVPEFLPVDETVNLENLTSAQAALLSAVKISASFNVYTGYGTNTSTAIQEGAGVIYKLDKEAGDAYIITNYHVVYNRNASNSSKLSADISLYLYGQEGEAYKIKALCLGGSMTYDLAVLRVSGSEVLKNSYAKAAALGNSDTVTPLDTVVAIGNPERQGISVTEGIVSVDNELLSMLGADGYSAVSLRVMRVSAAINEGNSGGGLFDAQGKLVGIVVAKKSGSDIDNIGYAIPINSAKNTADAIIHYCDGTTNVTLYKCIVGITPDANVTGLVIDEASGKIIKAERVIVEGVNNDSLLSGILGVGDVINSVTVDGVKKEVTRIHHVLDHMMTARVGSTVSFNITRDSVTFEITPITLPESSKVAVK